MTQYPDIRLKKCDEHYSWFEVTEDCRYSSDFFPELIIPKGYKTDFASVPRWLWPLFPPHGRMSMPAIVHDYIYDHRVGECVHGETTARHRADINFAFNCIKAGVFDWQLSLAYIFVRLFGRKWWRI